MSFAFNLNSKVIIAGFATFAMFFGSGNLVFPIMMGATSKSNWQFAALGLGITGVLVPFLGLVAMTLLNGSQNAYFRWIGKVGAWIIPFLILLLIGPFGVIPRCITVAYGAWHSFSEQTPLWAFSIASIIIIWLSTRGNSKIIGIIGKFFTPIKLGTLLLVIGGAIYFTFSENLSPIHNSNFGHFESFKMGFLEGYQTLDLMAALFFGISLVDYFKSKETNMVDIKKSITAKALGMTLLMIIYMALVYLGASFSERISHLTKTPTRMLPAIAEIALGNISNYLVSFTLIVACITTAVALTSVSVDFLSSKIPLLNGRKNITLFLCLGVSFVIALTGFSGIMIFMSPILFWLYPVLIGLTILNIVTECISKRKTMPTQDQMKLKKAS